MCVLTNARYKTCQTEFAFCRLGHAPGMGLGGAGVKHISMGIYDCSPSTAHSSLYFVFVFALLSYLCLAALRSPAGKGLASGPSCM